MLDTDLLAQLRTLLSDLPSKLSLVQDSSRHEKEEELTGMLAEIASVSAHVEHIRSGKTSATPRFELHRDGAATGISFRGIPGGHEFTSLVLALLNSSGKGKLPDAGIQARIARLQGPVSLRTYVSLSCTNCPDVVQALNVMSLFHADFQHEMVDGDLVIEEVQALGLQGVPAVVHDGHLLHSGKADLASLLDTLESSLGTTQIAPESAQEFDVIVVGGGPAGSSAAIYSARKGLRTALVAGRIGGQVKDTRGIENLISVPYTEGPQLAADLHKHLSSYEVTILENRTVERITDHGTAKEVLLKGGERLSAPALIMATGAQWRELGVPGEKEHIGRGVAFCPHCDGPFYKGKPVAVVGGGNSGVEAAIDLAGICSHVTLFEFADALRADAVLVEKLRSLPNTTIHTSARSTKVVGDGTKVSALEWEDRTTGQAQVTALEGVFVQIGLSPQSQLVKELVAVNRIGEIVIDEKCRTNVPGIYAAGDVTTVPWKQIVISMGEGAKAALAAFEDRMRSGT
jgi:NADH-dependent peroxiredoxin subunit F